MPARWSVLSPDPEADRAVNELYDHGAELVEAAAALHALVAAPAAADAMPAVLGCLQTALLDLAEGIAELEDAMERSLGQLDDRRARSRITRLGRGLTTLEQRLQDASTAAAAARALAVRAAGTTP